MTSSIHKSNILGELAAESDEDMLKSAFFETANYRALSQGSDIRFVVGRRGTGKSALFRKVSDALANNKSYILLTERPAEETIGSLRSEIRKQSSEYLTTRWITKIVWRTQILTQVLDKILGHYKADRIEGVAELLSYRKNHQRVFAKSGMARGLESLRSAFEACPVTSAEQVPERVAEYFELGWLESQVVKALDKINKKVAFLYDGLDEGWVPDQVGTGVVGGLAKLAAEFGETRNIHCILFVRDNMFRAIAQLDGDFSRNIEGNTLRLHWDEKTLLGLVALRLKMAFSYSSERNITIWNRFAKKELSGEDGFNRCLKLTLYRPRDVIALLNGAYQSAQSDEREQIVESDIERVAIKISQTRLNDLYREYEQVFPGLQTFAESLRGQAAILVYRSVLSLLGGIVDREKISGYTPRVARDFALLKDAADVFSALYSIGFLGVKESKERIRFCHDGSNADIGAIPMDTGVAVHPCYWRALDLQGEADSASLIIRVDDEDERANARSGKEDVSDMRKRRLGAALAELGNIRKGVDDAERFEKWVHDAASYLFARGLDNIVRRSRPGQTNRQDILGAIREDASGFWRRLAKSYDVRQMIIVAYNLEEITRDEFLQVWSYLYGQHGRCLLVVSHADSENLTKREQALIEEGCDATPSKMVVLVPAILLHRMMGKMRAAESRDDYIESRLSKRLDKFEREYVQQRTQRRT
jgi:hypothetical protein